MANYRKIYEHYYGVKIPNGYHVHHKDLNHTNNDPLNLEALHPDVHAQKHGFLTNFLMAHSTRAERSAIIRWTPEKRAAWSVKMKNSKFGIGKICLGKHYNSGKIHSPEQNAEQGLRNKGKQFHLGHKQSTVWKQKQSHRMMGTKHTEAQKQACAKSMRAWWAKKKASKS